MRAGKISKKRKFRIIGRNDLVAYGIHYNRFGYPCVKIKGKHIILHVFVWELENGKKPKGFEIHHKDFDKRNFMPANLELLRASDHRRLHFGWVKNGDTWTHKPCSECGEVLPLGYFYSNGHGSPGNCCKECNKAKVKDWAKNNLEKRRRTSRESMRRMRGENNNRQSRTTGISV